MPAKAPQRPQERRAGWISYQPRRILTDTNPPDYEFTAGSFKEIAQPRERHGWEDAFFIPGYPNLLLFLDQVLPLLKQQEVPE